MKATNFYLYSKLTAAFCVVLLLSSCSLFNRESDPVDVEQRLAQSLEDERELVQSVITDKERADRFITLIDARDQLVREQTEAMKQHRDLVAAISADYHATRDYFDASFRVYNAARDSKQREYLAVVVAMKDTTTAKEWKAISKYQLKSLNPRELAYKDIGDLF